MVSSGMSLKKQLAVSSKIHVPLPFENSYNFIPKAKIAKDRHNYVAESLITGKNL